MPASAATAATVSGRSPERTAIRRPARAGTRRSRARRCAAARRGRRGRASCAIAGGAPRRRRRRAMPKATTRRPRPRLLVRERLQAAEREELGRAEHVRRLAELHRAPAAARRERHGRARLLGDGGAVVGDRARASRSGSASSRRSVRARARARPRRRRRRGRDRLDLEAGVRQRAGLVDADRVDRRERLDRVQLLRERAAARHAHRRDGVREAREQDQALGNERDDRGDGRRHRVVHRRVPAVERPAERDAERDEHRDEDQQEQVDRALERRARVAELARLARRSRAA